MKLNCLEIAIYKLKELIFFIKPIFYEPKILILDEPIKRSQEKGTNFEDYLIEKNGGSTK